MTIGEIVRRPLSEFVSRWELRHIENAIYNNRLDKYGVEHRVNRITELERTVSRLTSERDMLLAHLGLEFAHEPEQTIEPKLVLRKRKKGGKQ